MSQAKRFTRIVTSNADGSAFADDEIHVDTPVAIAGMPPGHAGPLPAAPSAAYVRADMSGTAPPPVPHPAPARQWVAMLRGVFEVEVTDGTRRT